MEPVPVNAGVCSNRWAERLLELNRRRIDSGVELAQARQDLYDALAQAALTGPAIRSAVRVWDARRKELRFVATAGCGWTDQIRTRVYKADELSAGRYAVEHREPYFI